MFEAPITNKGIYCESNNMLNPFRYGKTNGAWLDRIVGLTQKIASRPSWTQQGRRQAAKRIKFEMSLALQLWFSVQRQDSTSRSVAEHCSTQSDSWWSPQIVPLTRIKIEVVLHLLVPISPCSCHMANFFRFI